MKSFLRAVVVILAAGAVANCSGPADTQNTKAKPTSDGVGRQFQSGADRVGKGAAEIGESIKQGAIVTWEAIKSGANAAIDTFDNDRKSSNSNKRGPASKDGTDASN